MKINFLIQSENPSSPIYVRFIDGRLFDLKAKTGLVIDPDNWQLINKNKKVKNNTSKTGRPGWPKTTAKDAGQKSEVNEINSKLKDFEARLTAAYNSVESKEDITPQWLQDFINPGKFEVIPSDLIKYFEYYEQVKKHELMPASVTKLKVVKHLLERFETDTKTVYRIRDVDDDFKNKFVSFARANGYAPNTTARNFKFIKTVCYHAEANGIQISPRLKHVLMKTVKVEKIYLSPSDLALIEKKKFKVDHLNNAKDWLLISCETGQRVSDFMRFKKEMIRYEGGKPLIEFTQVKTGKIMTIPLSKKVISILQKRKGEFPPRMTDQRYNLYIKTVCEGAGITYSVKGSVINKKTLRKETGTYPKWQLVSSHIGRRSFASNNYGRIPTSLLIGATGHTTEAAFLAYIGKTDTQKALALAEYF